MLTDSIHESKFDCGEKESALGCWLDKHYSFLLWTRNQPVKIFFTLSRVHHWWIFRRESITKTQIAKKVLRHLMCFSLVLLHWSVDTIVATAEEQLEAHNQARVNNEFPREIANDYSFSQLPTLLRRGTWFAADDRHLCFLFAEKLRCFLTINPSANDRS